MANYLLPFEAAATARTDKGNYWWELRACDYYDEFEKPKLIIPTFATSAPYTFDTNGLYSNDKTTIITVDDLFILGILNSMPTDFFFKSIGAKLKDNFYEYKPKYLSQLPIPNATSAQQAEIATLVNPSSPPVPRMLRQTLPMTRRPWMRSWFACLTSRPRR